MPACVEEHVPFLTASLHLGPKKVFNVNPTMTFGEILNSYCTLYNITSQNTTLRYFDTVLQGKDTPQSVNYHNSMQSKYQRFRLLVQNERRRTSGSYGQNTAKQRSYSKKDGESFEGDSSRTV